MPIVHLGLWCETLQKWVAEGYLGQDEIPHWGDGTPAEAKIAVKLGLDSYWGDWCSPSGLQVDALVLYEEMTRAEADPYCECKSGALRWGEA